MQPSQARTLQISLAYVKDDKRGSPPHTTATCNGTRSTAMAANALKEFPFLPASGGPAVNKLIYCLKQYDARIYSLFNVPRHWDFKNEIG